MHTLTRSVNDGRLVGKDGRSCWSHTMPSCTGVTLGHTCSTRHTLLMWSVSVWVYLPPRCVGDHQVTCSSWSHHTSELWPLLFCQLLPQCISLYTLCRITISYMNIAMLDFCIMISWKQSRAYFKKLIRTVEHFECLYHTGYYPYT